MTNLFTLCTLTDVMRARLDADFDLQERKALDDPLGWLDENGPDIRFLLTDGHLGVPDEVLSRLPNLEVVSSYGVGYDAIDTDITNARGIPVCHTPGVLNEEVATTALALYLACWRNLETMFENARSGRWEADGGPPLSRSADNRTIGILGLGRIGKALVRKLEPFGVTVLYHGRSKQDVPYRFYPSLTDMARDCETLISIAPGGAATHHLIDREVMDAIGPEGFLINVGRGSTVDEAALIDALKEGTLGGAGLDVFEDEPHIPEALRALQNVTLMPHVGSATIETRRAMGDLAIDNLIAWKQGKPLLTPVPESQGVLEG